MKCRDATISIASGVLISICTVLLLTGISAKILISGTVGEGSARWFVLLSLIIASMIGCVIPSIICKNKATMPALIAAGNMLLVTCCSFILEGPFQSAGETLLAILLSGTIACVICMKRTPRNRKRKKHYR